jgi:hypothetical protein
MSNSEVIDLPKIVAYSTVSRCELYHDHDGTNPTYWFEVHLELPKSIQGVIQTLSFTVTWDKDWKMLEDVLVSNGWTTEVRHIDAKTGDIIIV